MQYISGGVHRKINGLAENLSLSSHSSQSVEGNALVSQLTEGIGVSDL